MSNPIMCHVVAGYPSEPDCLKLLKGMQAHGVAAIEVQIPFSDPIADGPTIMQANDDALAGGMTTQASFDLIAAARQAGLTTPIYIMSYAQKLLHFGFAEFCEQAHKVGVAGFIIPDLPYDSSDYQALIRITDIPIVPVVSPAMNDDRLQNILKLQSNVIYVTSRQGITGTAYQAHQELEQLAAGIKATTTAQLLIGFGIGSVKDVEAALRFGDVAVVGSAVIRAVQSDGTEGALKLIGQLINGES